jgi:hypothetical protein
MSDADCNGKACDTKNGSCGETLDGDQCNSNAECRSKHCVDKTCCAVGACGTCETCATGVCIPVPNNMPDPDSCSDSMNPCGTTGKCDGMSKCKFGAAGTECDRACVNNEVVTTTCDGNGACNTPGGTMACDAPLVCVNNACEQPPPPPPDGGP